MGETAPRTAASGRERLVRCHRLPTRLWHWANVVMLLVLLMSGLAIFNAHPRLYWGEYGANHDPAWMEISSTEEIGFVRVGDFDVETTGVLGRWETDGGYVQRLAFPGWATLPSYYDLALARRWHLTFAWGFIAAFAAYAVWALVSGHLWRDLMPRRGPPQPVGPCYNLGQKLGYAVVLVLLLPGVILSGLTMSPAMVAAWPWLLDLFGGRQSARSVHFILAAMLVVFAVGHIALVLAKHPLAKLRGMITGRVRRPEAPAE